MRIERDALARTIEYLDAHPEVAVMGAKLFNSHGKPMHHLRRFPTLMNQLAVIFKLPHVFPGLLDHYHGKDLNLEHEQFVDSVRGSYFAINETAIKRLGNLDEKYFLWFEEVDYSRRAKHEGMKVAYVPSVVAYDAVGKSFAQHELRWKQERVRESMIIYFAKWHSGWELLLVRGAWLLIRPIMYLL
jgi:GT2 family glycosyltransferase